MLDGKQFVSSACLCMKIANDVAFCFVLFTAEYFPESLIQEDYIDNLKACFNGIADENKCT